MSGASGLLLRPSYTQFYKMKNWGYIIWWASYLQQPNTNPSMALALRHQKVRQSTIPQLPKTQVKHADYDAYDTAIRCTRNFIIAVVEDTWIRELRDPISRYNDVSPQAIMLHLTTTCVGIHALDVLTLQNAM